MHREYHPEEMRHLHAHAFGGGHDEGDGHGERTADEDRGLFAFTTLLGLLLATDLVLDQFGVSYRSFSSGVSLTFLAAILGSARIVYGALSALAEGRVGADIALAQAAVAALVLGEYFVAAEVVFIALVGECLEAITARRAMRAIQRLFEQTPRVARVRREGREIEIPISLVEVGDTVIVAAGEKIAVDGPILEGRTSVDQSALTGESMPVDRGPGETVFAGTLNQFGRLELRAERVGHETALGQVLRLVMEAQRRKAPLHRAADRYARWFLPVVEIAAAITLLAGYRLGWPDVWERAVAILVVACPCALVLATPAAIMASMAWLARHGVVIKGGAALERLASCDTLAFDKTGTLTEGRPEFVDVFPLARWRADEVIALAAAAESSSRHPLAEVVREAASERGLDVPRAEDVVAHPGAGVAARVPDRDGGGFRSVLVGNVRLLGESGITLNDDALTALDAMDAEGLTALIVAVDGVPVGILSARDTIRPEAHDVVHDLKHLGFTEVAVLTGDRNAAARLVGRRTHIKNVEAELLPADKAAWVRRRQEEGRRVVMVGDGINDAPALATAHVGIALGRVGADLAVEAGDVILLGEPLGVLPDLVRLSRKTVAILRQNILGFAFGLNALAILLAFLGILGPVPAAILHQAGSLLVLLNSMRLLAFGDWGRLPPVRVLRSAGRSLSRLDDRIDAAACWETLVSYRRHGLLGLGIGVAVVYATWGWTAIAPHETGLLRRFGAFVKPLEPGLHLRWPPPIETVTRLEPSRIQSLEIGFRGLGSNPDTDLISWESSHDRVTTARDEDEATVLTGDGRLIEIAAVAQYRIRSDVESYRRYAFRSPDPRVALRFMTESALRSIVSRRELRDLLSGAQQESETAVAEELRRRVDRADLGVEVVSVAFLDVHPPLAVVHSFRDVSRAETERQGRENDGHTYRSEQIKRVDGQAVATRMSAEAARVRRIAQAKGDSDSFDARRIARIQNPAETDRRLYIESLARTLAGRDKWIIDPPRDAKIRTYLLPDTLPVPLIPAAPETAEVFIPSAPPRTPPSGSDRRGSPNLGVDSSK